MRRTRSPPPVRAAKNNRISNEMMKNKSASHLRHRVASTQRISVSAFFNLRVLLGLFVLLASVLVVLFATSATGRTRRGEANPLGFDSGPPTARSAQTKRSSSASTSTAEALLSDLSQGCTDPMRRLAARVYRPNGFRFSPSGNVQEEWAKGYNGPGNFSDQAFAIAIDGSGNVYVTGASFGSGTDYDYATIKYNPADGSEVWVVRYNGPGNFYDGAAALAIDGSGNVYVAGESVASGTTLDYATIKYNASGTEEWVARYNGPGNLFDHPFAIAVDGAGNVYVTGQSFGSGTDFDYATVKYNAADGAEEWIARYNGPENFVDQALAIGIDGPGNVYVTGGSMGSGTDFDYATIKYNAADGAEDWVTRYNGPGNGADAARAIAIDGSGNVYVTGESFAGAETDYATIKYSQSPGGTPTPTATPTPRPTPTSRPRPTPLPRPTPPR